MAAPTTHSLTEQVRTALHEFPLVQAAPAGGPVYLRATPGALHWGWLPGADDPPALTVAPGEVVCVDTVSHEGVLPDQGRDPRRFFGGFGVPPDGVLVDAAALAGSAIAHDPATDGPHVLTGPIAVHGARPGDVLSVSVLDLVPRAPYGIVSSRHGKGALPGEVIGDDPVFSAFCLVEPGADGVAMGSIARRETAPEQRVRFPLAPFLGVMGVAAPNRLPSVPPGAHGGNLDVPLLGVGSTLHLPVQVPDALFYVGDPHFAQGNGEVALTAFEAPLRATLRLDLTPAELARERFGALGGPLGETARLWVPIGLDQDLNEAMRACVRESLRLLTHRYGMDRRLAYAYLSAAADYSVSQVVDEVTGVHGAIRKADFQ